jgi:O-antigen/teichoic acid export membrane protein
MEPMLGRDWWKARLRTIQNRRELVKFALSTNLSGTINMIIRDSEILWVGLFTSTVQAGYYKFALAIMNVAYLPVTSLVTTTFPQISASVARHEWPSLSRLLRRTSLLVSGWTAATFLGLALLGPWLLAWMKDGAYLPSLPGMLILSLGMGIPNIFFWNRPLLLSFGKPNYPLAVNGIAGVVKTALMFVLVRPFGYLMQVGLLSGYFLISVGLNARKGLLELRQAVKEDILKGEQ